MTIEEVWLNLRQEAEVVAAKEFILAKVLAEFVLERESFADALGWRLAARERAVAPQEQALHAERHRAHSQRSSQPR